MDRSIPAGAARLLDFIGSKEAPKGYGTVYGNNQHKLAKPLTSMTVGEIINAKPTFTKRFGSSACGRYQFMRATLQGLVKEGAVKSSEVLTPDLQDRLGYHLLKRRGYAAFMSGRMTRTEFGKRLAQEWASFPVLANTKGAHRQVKRGQTYYAGDGLNKALVSAAEVERVLDEVLSASSVVSLIPAPPEEREPPEPVEYIDEDMPDAVPGPERLSDPVMPADQLMSLQAKLRDIGYSEVGEVDGLWGGKTTGAFAAFQQDNGLPVTGRPDEETVRRIYLAPTNSRPISDERKNITAKDIKENSPVIQATSSIKSTTLWGSIVGFFTLIYNAVIGYAGDAWDYLRDFRNVLDFIPTWAWIVAVIGVALYFHRKADKAEKARVQAERQGVVTTTEDPTEGI